MEDSRYIVDKRNGIIAILDTQNPEYHLRNNGLCGDEPWVVASWGGFTTKDERGFISHNLYDYQIDKADYLCSLLNKPNKN